MLIIDSPIACLKRFRRAIRLRLLCLKAMAQRKLTDIEFFEFHCNICGHYAVAPLSAVSHREIPSCFSCGSSKRLRSIIAALSTELYGKIIPLSNFVNSKEIIGVGLSDAAVYAPRVGTVFTYKNTYYHKEPRLDITSLPKDMENSADFVIASDVFEHIPPPADIAFRNLFQMLKDKGICIFSVPFNNTGATVEYYPELFEYEIVKEKGKCILVNRTRQGTLQRFENPKFHGGPGATLEMRMYSRNSLIRDIEKARFTDIKIYEDSIPEFGILNDRSDSSFVISMRKRR
jgi:SAM-dependent methyltransferase